MKLALLFLLCASISSSSAEVKLGPLIPFGTKISAEYPAIAIDKSDTIWVAWSEPTNGSDAIYLSSFNRKTWSEKKLVSSGTGSEYEPLIAADIKGGVWLVWSGKRVGKWNIYARYFDGTAFGSEIQVTDGTSDNLHPAIAVDNEGSLCVSWMSDRTGKHQIDFVRIQNGKVSEIRNVTDNSVDNFRPALAIDKQGIIWLAYHSYLGNGNYDVYLTSMRKGKWESPVAVTTHPGIDAYPSIAIDAQNRVWLAWHSNRKSDDLGLKTQDLGLHFDIPKWVYVKGYDPKKKQWFEPEGEMPGKDLDKHGVDQGFEFPTLFIDNSNRVWIFGRPSHDWAAQYYDGNANRRPRWSELIRLSDGSWGGRGQFMRAAEDANGNIWLVRRDIGSNFLQKIEVGARFIAPAQSFLTKQVKHGFDESNPYTKKSEIIAHETVDNYTVYYGDIHTHSWLSDGIGSVEETFTRMRDVYQFDFGALTDHEDFVQNRMTPAEWEEVKHWSAYYNNPGKFVTIPAYEWTGARVPIGDGHVNVYFPDERYAIYPKRDNATKTATGLFSALEKLGALGFAHHIGWTGINWDAHNPKVQTCIEIVSNHGAYEYMGNEPIKHRGGIPGCFIQDGLAKGLKFGIIGGSDGHGLLWQHGVSYKRDPWRAGWTGVYAKSLTREGILDAYRNRRTFATTGEKIFLNFHADGHVLGEEYSTSTTPTFSVQVKGTNLLHYIYLIRNNEVIYTNGGDSNEALFKFTDTQIQPGTSWYYLRVLQRDGNMAWSSPIWVNYQTETMTTSEQKPSKL